MDSVYSRATGGDLDTSIEYGKRSQQAQLESKAGKQEISSSNSNGLGAIEFSVSSSDEWDNTSFIVAHHDDLNDFIPQTSSEEKEYSKWPGLYNKSELNTTNSTTNKHKNSDSYQSNLSLGKTLDEASHIFIDIAFLLISFGYMLPWTSLGSLISYYKETFNANFYVKLYCAYYLPGLPVALLQLKYDGDLDLKYGSKNTYLWRGLFAYVSMIIILILMVWFNHPTVLLMLFTLLGVCGWLCHGTASMLASMYPSSAIAWLQTGFRCPEIYTIVAVAALQIGKTATSYHLVLFYCITAVVVSIGMVAWIFVVTSVSSKRYFELKDTRMQTLDDAERKPLINAKYAGHSVNEDEDTTLPGQANGKKEKSVQMLESMIIAKSWLKSQETNSTKSMRSSVYNDVLPLCFALVITMWCSIFQASFFAYVDSPVGRDIEQILYFVRLFSDLLGRPLTRLYRPSFIQTNQRLLMASMLRIVLMVLFFVYLFVPSFPRSDIYVSILVGIFSVLSGYFTVLIYEFAARGKDGAAQTYATQLLNICFQIAAFTAVSLSVIITSTGWVEGWISGRR